LQLRDGVERAYQLQFDTDEGLWAEIQNPYGPSRKRVMRAFSVEADAKTLHTTVLSPNDWPYNPDNGKTEIWTVELGADGTTLAIVGDGAVEEFSQGPWPKPTDGLTAMVHVFPSGGPVDDAFCSSGASGFDYPTFLEVARGLGQELPLGIDVVAGVRPGAWHDASDNNQFSVRNVPGFERLGGTELSDTFNFFVTYFGELQHPGGELGFRELDDVVEDGVWVFLGDGVGSSDPLDIAFEVHGFAWNDDEEIYTDRPAGAVAFEIVSARCAVAIEDVDLEWRVAGAPWEPMGKASFTPVVTAELFPPAL
jgi:hypothetical protein